MFAYNRPGRCDTVLCLLEVTRQGQYNDRGTKSDVYGCLVSVSGPLNPARRSGGAL